MTLAPGLLRESPSSSKGRAVELLRGALVDDALVELGWDADGLVLGPVPGHPSFGFRVCEVQDCTGPITRRGNVCGTCFQRFERSAAAGRCSDLSEFKRIRRQPTRPPERRCAVCCVAPDHQRPVAGNRLCGAHDALRKRAGLAFDEFVALDSVVPFRTFGTCQRTGCTRVAAGRRRLCKACEKQWTQRDRPDLAVFCADRYIVENVAKVAPIFLDGLPEQVRLELLFIAQRFCEQLRKGSREGWRGLVRDARAAGVGSLLELDRGEVSCQVLLVRRLAQYELEVLYADQDTEFAGDVWDLRKIGLAVERNTVVLDFSAIAQDWLREAANGWARCRAVTTQGNSLKAALLAVGLLSESLALREDGGAHKSALARVDVRAFVERLSRLHRAGRLPETSYYRSAGKVRQFLRDCKDFGLYEPGAPLHGLSSEFAVWLQDVRRPAKDEDDGGEERALPQVVIDQLLSDTYLDLLRNRHGVDVCVMLRILADTGRRPGELAVLMATCLDRTEFVDEQTGELQSAWVLVHDMPKVAVKHYRLFIAESTARLIIEQRERVVVRYPGTPLSQLRLFPRDRRNPHGTLPVYSARLSCAVRDWRDGLTRLVGAAGEDFPRERVIPYAFRHSFAQRHADNGTPLDVLAAMMGHRTTDTTRGYYKVNKSRMRKAVARVGNAAQPRRQPRQPQLRRARRRRV